MKCAILIFLTLSLGVSSISIITNVLKELTPLIAGVGQTIEEVSKEVGGLIGDTFFNLDRIVSDAEVKIQVKITDIDLILSKQETNNRESCAAELKISEITSTCQYLEIALILLV
ncbi:hypothetical protein WA026_019181 [Henosepilachna vigintioctopunctata]|uniref:Uncharacterized protein n=1 Tax=Henosepilachna vigintioctopunctata TaxID=420089 RepID=A0AAW1V3Q4_9CUCU